ncbi:MAG TPA: SDR family NAD(P)-dependent oxidoreductase [Dehalococcoidia bacterium]|nr:SDR family NAD(P)-dependent oxidoreductase [Dehalococcoidia bacterium]
MNPLGRTAIVTGASSGIGAATAVEIGRKGANVALFARREDRLHDVATRVEIAGGRALFVPGDVSCGQDIDALVAATLERFGTIDVLINNAGYGLSLTVEETSAEALRDIFAVNYFGAFDATRAVLPHMRAAGAGHIAFVSSVVGKLAFPYHGAYASTKAALISLAQALHDEVASENIRVSVVLPANTRTEFFAVQSRLSRHESGMIGFSQSPERVARAIVRSIEKPTSEINIVPPMRFAYAIDALFPALRGMAGRWFYRYRSPNEST